MILYVSKWYSPWWLIGIELGKKRCYIPKVSKFYVEKRWKYKKWPIFDTVIIAITITLGVNMVDKQVIPFSCLLFELYPLVYFIFVFQDVKNSVMWGLSFALFSSL